MSKYDFEIDLSDRTSTGIILRKIKKGSTVLEFGCAYGRMTRYMSREMDCRVYVVEYDASGYEKAKEFAVDGLCDDLMNFAWETRFAELRFDAIIFADVLEHITDPVQVLRRASALLKDGGSIYMSVPNITHNDILLKAAQERFDYTPVGILDDTHRYFWGLENLAPTVAAAGLSLRTLEATYCPTGYTEQYGGKQEGSLLLKNLLNLRRSAEVYQFVLTMDKTAGGETRCSVAAPGVKSHVYLDTGKGFNTEEILAFDSAYTGSGYRIHCRIPGTAGARQIRLDPVEQQSCILQDLTVTQDGKILPVTSPAWIPLEQGLLLAGEDPMVLAEVAPEGGDITVDALLQLPGEEFLRLLQEDSRIVHDLAESRAGQITVLEQVYDQTRCHNADLERALEETGARLAEALERGGAMAEQLIGLQHDHVTERKRIQDELDLLKRDYAQCRVDIGAYILLANTKDLYALELERELAAQRAENEKLRRDNAYMQNEILYFQSMRIIKTRALLIRIARGLKRRILKILGRGENHE